MRYIIIGFLLLISSQFALAQFSDNSQVREKFSYEIIQIEEFIERFNVDKSTKLLKYIKEQNPDMVVDRREFITTLFDYNYYITEESLISEFVDFACNPSDPFYLSFYDSDWYAEVSCLVEYQNKEDIARLIMMNQFEADSASKWVISGVSCKLFEFPESKDTMAILSPVSHGTGFIALHNAFNDGKNAQNYITDDLVMDELSYMVFMMKSNKIDIKEVSGTKYHFLQIPGWALTIEYLNRKELNAGWLITNLRKLSPEEKEIYKKDVLNINHGACSK